MLQVIQEGEQVVRSLSPLTLTDRGSCAASDAPRHDDHSYLSCFRSQRFDLLVIRPCDTRPTGGHFLMPRACRGILDAVVVDPLLPVQTAEAGPADPHLSCTAESVFGARISTAGA